MKHIQKQIKKQHELAINRSYTIVKSNDLIQKTRFNLPLQEQKIILYLLTKIKPTDTIFSSYKFKIKEFCELCGLEVGNHEYLKSAIKKLKDRSFWATIDEKGTESLLSWIGTARTNKKEGWVTIKLHEDMFPFVLELKDRFTQYSLYYTLPMKSQYSIRLYELLKSYQNLGEWSIKINDLKRRFSAENYVQWNDFKRRILDYSIKEINKYTDISVSYELKKEVRRFTDISFTIVTKKDTEKAETWSQIEMILERNNA